jgi:hypothetical protein
MNKANAFGVIAALVFVLFESASAEQPDAVSGGRVELQVQLRLLEYQVDHLQADVHRLESDLRFERVAATIPVQLVFGVFCALWAQNNRRNPWLWFILGLFLGVFAGIMMLYRNFQDRLSERIAKKVEALKRTEP